MEEIPIPMASGDPAIIDHCPRCGHKNHLRAAYCNQCGRQLDPNRALKDDRGRARLHADLAHPINSPTRIEGGFGSPPAPGSPGASAGEPRVNHRAVTPTVARSSVARSAEIVSA